MVLRDLCKSVDADVVVVNVPGLFASRHWRIGRCHRSSIGCHWAPLTAPFGGQVVAVVRRARVKDA